MRWGELGAKGPAEMFIERVLRCYGDVDDKPLGHGDIESDVPFRIARNDRNSNRSEISSEAFTLRHGQAVAGASLCSADRSFRNRYRRSSGSVPVHGLMRAGRLTLRAETALAETVLGEQPYNPARLSLASMFHKSS
jgi:hypothetical protein